MSETQIYLLLACIECWLFAWLAATNAYRTDKCMYYPRLSVSLHPLPAILLFLHPRRKKTPIASIVAAAASEATILALVICSHFSIPLSDSVCAILKNIFWASPLPLTAVIMIDDRIHNPHKEDHGTSPAEIEAYISNPGLYDDFSGKKNITQRLLWKKRGRKDRRRR